MPQGNPLGYLPPDVLAQLLGGLPMSGAGMASRGGGLGQSLMPMLSGSAPAPTSFSPAASSPEYADMIRRGMAPMPQQGSMEYLDYMQRNPGSNQPGQPQAGGQQENQSGIRNLMDILMGSSPVQQPGYGRQP